MRPRICVVGSSNMDLILRTPRLPKPGETLTATSLSTCAGGKGGNQAVMAARLGADVTMVGKVGRDAFGEQLRRNYEAEGIDTTYLFDDKQPTGMATILVDDQGENCIVVAPGANGSLTSKDVRKAAKAIRSADMVLCQFEVPMEATLEALDIARRAGVDTILNPAPFQPLPRGLPAVRFLVLNETEFRQLTHFSGKTLQAMEKAIGQFWIDTGMNALVTLGARAVLANFGPTVRREKPVAVQALDTSGAGDAFVGAFAFFATREDMFEDVVRRAMGVAALTVTRAGTQSSYPTRREAFRFLREHGLS